jgi:hypothetical protein
LLEIFRKIKYLLFHFKGLVRLCASLAGGFWMSLAVATLLWSCSLFNEVVDRGYHVMGLGFASDTTAILLKLYWEQIEEPCYFGSNCDDWVENKEVELQLVDVRFKKLYWNSSVKNGGYGSWAKQWSDSTMLMGNSDREYWLWTIGSSQPQKINFNWKIEEKEIDMYITAHNLIRWREDSLFAENFIIDTKTKTVNKWETIGCINWCGKVAGEGA